MMLLDLQGSMCELYDPEIATTILQEEEGGETNFCAGNLTIQVISTFKQEHQCNTSCAMLGSNEE